MNESLPDPDRATRYRNVALCALRRLRKGDHRPETLHRLRVHLRRLQALHELLGEHANARLMDECVSRLSRLRALHVLKQYLDKLDADEADLKTIQDLIRNKRAKLVRKRRFAEIEEVVRRHGVPPAPRHAQWLVERIRALRPANAQALGRLTADVQRRPKRKALHALRLKIKSVRYQEEWALGQPFGKPDAVRRLKQAQGVLGAYEERAQFREMAARLGLGASRTIERDWRRSRKRARAVVGEVEEIVSVLMDRHLRLVLSRSRARRTPPPKPTLFQAS